MLAMQIIFDFMRWMHIIGGFLALAVFWIPIVSRKGGRVHRRAGWIYAAGMIAVSVSAFYMAVYRIAWDAGPEPDIIPFSWFLLFISILSATTAYYGIRVLRFKRRSAPHRAVLDYLLPVLLFASGIGMSIYGFALQFPLLSYFPWLGIFLGGSMLFYWMTAPKTRSHWAVEHIIGMMSCCIATITAFIVFGAPRLLNIDAVNLIIWFLPTILLVPLILYFIYQYRKKMDGNRAMHGAHNEKM